MQNCVARQTSELCKRKPKRGRRNYASLHFVARTLFEFRKLWFDIRNLPVPACTHLCDIN